MAESDPYRHLYLPLMLSMTLGQPGAYWNARYEEELARVNAARVEATKTQPSGRGASPVSAPAASLKVVVQTALDELYAWYGLPATVLMIACVAQLPIALTDPILDVGTGNGHVCEFLRLSGRRHVTGTDASAKAIELATTARALRALDDAAELRDAHIAFLVDDILQSSLPSAAFAVIIDKGTLDSIAMCPSSSGAPLSNEQVFARQITRILRPGGYFFILSCNHTLAEMSSLMLPSGLSLHRDLSSNVTISDPDLTLLCFMKPAST